MPTPNTDVTLTTLREARQKSSMLHRAAYWKHRKEQLASHKAIRNLLKANLIKAGFDFEEFRPLINQSNAEARQRAADIIAEADQQPGAQESLRRMVEGLTERAENLQAIPGITVEYLETATEISSWEIAPPIHERREPGNNSSRFVLNKVYDDFGFLVGGAGVSFGFLWQNPADISAIVNVDAYLVLHGACLVQTNNGFIDLTNAFLSTDAKLYIHELWNNPPTAPIDQPFQSQNALNISCNTEGIFELTGDMDWGYISTAFDLQYRELVIPPRAMAMFEVACEFSYGIFGNEGGSVQASFMQDPNQVLCPGVLITRLL
jgi:hypothetical protein